MVPLAAETGDVGEHAFVAVRVKRALASPTMWLSLGLVAESVLDAVLNVLLPMLASDAAFDPAKLWRPCLTAAVGAVVAYRRKTMNTVIGSSGT